MGAMAASRHSVSFVPLQVAWQGLQCLQGTRYFVLEPKSCKLPLEDPDEEDIGMRSPASFVTTRSDAIESDGDAGCMGVHGTRHARHE